MNVLISFFGGSVVAFLVWLLTTAGGVTPTVVFFATPGAFVIGAVVTAIALTSRPR